MAKKALLVGVNAYASPSVNPLRGCVNDVQQISSVLQECYSFEPERIRLLKDKNATRRAILDGLDWLVDGAQPADILVFHYSGHGSHVADDSDEEFDCEDEILVPYDHDWSQPLRDDDIKAKFLPVPLDANLTFICDSCHSGTINKLAAANEVPRTLFVPDEEQRKIAVKVARRNAEYKVYALQRYREMANRLSQVELDAAMDQFLSETLNQFKQNRYQFVDTRENNILLAACQAQQTSVETVVGGDWHGAFTYNLVKIITQAGAGLTYQDLIARAGEGMLQQRQVPQLECPDHLKAFPLFSPLTS